MDFVGWKILLQVTNELPKAPATLSYRGGECTIELAVKQELPVLGIEAHDIGWQHIDGEIRRELRNVFAVTLCKLVSVIACHEVSMRIFAAAPDASARRILQPPGLRRQARAPAFLTLAFLDKFATHSAALRTPDARNHLCSVSSKTMLARSNLVKPGHDDLRLST